MRLFFACSNLVYRNQLLQNDVRNILIAYPYAKENLLKHFDWYIEQIDNVNLLIDSGAFSVWTLGEVIRVEDYTDFCKMMLKRYEGKLNSCHIVNLDKIPGEFGRKPNQAEIEDSAQVGRNNFHYMLKRGITTIPVFHQHEESKWLELMKNEVDYIGISPANDVDTKNRMIWMDGVYYDLKADYKTHSFGGIADSILKRYPLFSGDSSSWTNWARWGKGTKHHLKGWVTNQPEAVKHMMAKDVAKYKQTEEFITNLWKERGVVWE